MNNNTLLSLLLVFVSISFYSPCFGEMPLELIHVFHSDSAGAMLIKNCFSPGDLDNDGFSELIAVEIGNRNNLNIYKGGNPPDEFPDMIIEGGHGNVKMIEDINNDGLDDIAMTKAPINQTEILQIWYGSNNFLSKEGPDLVFTQGMDTVSAFGYSINVGDVNNDNQNDIIAGSVNMELPPFEGRFSIYYGGDIIDEECDEIINFYRGSEDYDCFYRGTAVGYLNNDGIVDYIVTRRNSSESISYVGIIYGSIPLSNIPVIEIPTPFVGREHSNNFGKELVPLGDINKDGYDDFAVGGSTLWPCIFYGGDPINTDPKILGDTTDDLTQGNVISNIGDINHDGWDDIGVGWTSYNFGSGIVRIYFGSSDMDTEADINLPYNIITPTPGMHFGYCVGPAGDFNGDGVDDMVISSRETWYSSSDHGNVYVFAGDPNLPLPAEDEPDEPLPEKYNILEQNYPNPFNNRTVIKYSLWGVLEREIDLSIYNILGQKVRTLYSGIQSSGDHVVYWDGTDEYGNNVSSGVYFYKLISGNQTLSKSMIYLK